MHAVLHRSGAQQAGHGRAAREAFERAGQFHQRLLLGRKARPQIGALAFDQTDACFLCGDFGFGLLDARGKGGGVGRGFVGRGARGGGAGLQFFGALAGGDGLLLRLRQTAADFGWIFGGCNDLRAGPAGQQQAGKDDPAPHYPAL